MKKTELNPVAKTGVRYYVQPNKSAVSRDSSTGGGASAKAKTLLAKARSK